VALALELVEQLALAARQVLGRLDLDLDVMSPVTLERSTGMPLP